MHRTIMVPTDGTGFDREAIRVALRLAEKRDAVVHLVRVTSQTLITTAGPGAQSAEAGVQAFTAARDRELSELYMLAAECRETSTVTIVTALEDGPVEEVLQAYCTRVSADMIVISSHGRHGIARLSLGSVTDALIRKARVPVLVVKPEPSYLNPRAPERFKLIVIPLDGSSLAEQIVASAVALAKLEESEVALVQVLSSESSESPGSFWEHDVPVAKAYLNRIAARFRRSGVRVSTDVLVGCSVSETIASFARAHRAQLIAIATHGRFGIRRVMRGSVADELARSAGISLLVLRPVSDAAQTPSRDTARVAAVV